MKSVLTHHWLGVGVRNGDTAHLNGVELDARQFTSVSIMCKRRAIPMRARKIVSYLYSRNCMHIEDASVCIQKVSAIIKKRTKDRIHLAVLLSRICADQRSEIIVCNLLLISAALVGVKRATGRQDSGR